MSTPPPPPPRGHFRLWPPSWTDWHIWPRSHHDGIDPMPNKMNLDYLTLFYCEFQKYEVMAMCVVGGQRYLFLYRFVYESEVLVTWFLVWVWEDWVPVYYVPFMFRGRPFLFSAVGFLLISKFFCVVLLVHKVSRSRFPFWRFLWVYLSFNFLYKLKFWLQNIPIDRRKPIIRLDMASFAHSEFRPHRFAQNKNGFAQK